MMALIIWFLTLIAAFLFREKLASISLIRVFLDGDGVSIADTVFFALLALLLPSLINEFGVAKGQARLVFTQQLIDISVPKIKRQFSFHEDIQRIEFLGTKSEVSGENEVHLIFGLEEIVLFPLDGAQDSRAFAACCEWALNKATELE